MKLKTLHFHPDERYARKFIYPLVEIERELGRDVELISERLLERRDNQLSTHQVRFYLSASKPFSTLYSIWTVYRFLSLRKESTVIVHNTLSTPAILGARLAGVRRVVYFNHGAGYLGEFGFVRSILQLIEFVNVILSDMVITVSESSKRGLNALSKNTPIKTLGPGSCCGIQINEKQDFDRRALSALKNSLEIPPEGIVILYLGRPTVRKGFFSALKAAEKARNSYYFVFCGAGIDSWAVDRKESKKLSNCRFLGFRDDLKLIFKAVDLMILPSYHEGLPYVVLESWKYSIPVLVRRAPGLSDLIRDGIDGSVFDSDDEINQKVDELLNNPASLHRMTEEGRLRVKNFDERAICSLYADLVYDEI